ncbi:RluA family pseudouridine synthase [Candidatus Gottesmanbacteria bacterium]|nr:RluA family pseudouridine synthase [Candidatus Gottesmanbacteria bacterium]
MSETKLDILYQDDFLLVINKPAGVVVNRAESVKDETIQDIIERDGLLDLAVDDEEFKKRTGLVHRIDKETSGCLIVAKQPDIYYQLTQAFKYQRIKKTYLALLHGKLVPREGTIDAPVGRLPWNKERFGIVPGGKESVTQYMVDRYFEKDGKFLSLVTFFPRTGRTHQIRVHAKYLGFPLVGDYLYGGRKQQILDRAWCPRVFLHALKIDFSHPVTNAHIQVQVPLPPDLREVLTVLKPINA